jgi:hypothetical protein
MQPQIIEAIIGAFLPIIIDFLNKKVDDSRIKYAVSLIVCLIAGAFININDINLNNFLASGALIFASAQTVYHTYWEKSNIRKTINN